MTAALGCLCPVCIDVCCKWGSAGLDAQKALYLLYVGFVYESGVVEVALALLRLFGEDVAVVGVLTLDLPRAGESETLLAGTVGFHFGHDSLLFSSCCFTSAMKGLRSLIIVSLC